MGRGCRTVAHPPGNALADGRQPEQIIGQQPVQIGRRRPGYLADAITDAREIAKLPADAPVIRYSAPFHFSRLLRFLGQKQDTSTKVQVSLVPESFHLQAGKLYYLSTHLFFRR